MNSKLTGKEIMEHQYLDIRCQEELYVSISSSKNLSKLGNDANHVYRYMSHWVAKARVEFMQLNQLQPTQNEWKFDMMEIFLILYLVLKRIERHTSQNLGPKVTSANWKSRKQLWIYIKKLFSKGNTNWYNKISWSFVYF